MRRIAPAVAGLIVAYSMALSAHADDTGPYLSLHGGWSSPETTRSEFDSGSLPGGVGFIDTEGDDGYRIGGAVGWIFNRYVSGELEVSYAAHDIDTLNALSSATYPLWSGPLEAKGDAESLSGMINGYLSLPVNRLRPYVGGGIGYTRVKADGVGFAGVSGETDDSDTAFTWQLLAGVGVQIAPDLELGARYRFQHVDDTTLYNSDGDEQRIGDSEAHSAEITLTWSWQRERGAAPIK